MTSTTQAEAPTNGQHMPPWRTAAETGLTATERHYFVHNKTAVLDGEKLRTGDRITPGSRV